MQHNRWLDWKIRKGLAARGRVGGKLHPKGLLAGLLYKYYYRKRFQADCESAQRAGQVIADRRTFQQSVGGTLGASGKVNGE